MARRTKRVTIHQQGRDRGKTFELTEMPADQAERWCSRGVLLFMNTHAKLPEGAAGLELTWRNVFAAGLSALHGLREVELRPLLEEIKPCIKWVPPGDAPLQAIFPGNDSQIEEFQTWWELYYEYVQLLLGFSLADVLSTTGITPETPPAS